MTCITVTRSRQKAEKALEFLRTQSLKSAQLLTDPDQQVWYLFVTENLESETIGYLKGYITCLTAETP